MIVGYARCSSQGQSYEGQVEALQVAGAETIFSEKESGARTDRPQLSRALATLKPGDVLTVTRLDRLARSTVDLHNILAKITAAGAGFRSINEPMLDTTTPHGKLLTAILGALGEFERSLILSRTEEGRRRAMARGAKFGPRPKLSARQIDDARRRIEAGETIAGMAELFKVSRQTISRAIR